MTRTLSLAAAIIGSLLFTSVARADPGDLASRCIEAIQEITQATRQRIHEATAAGVHQIQRLDAQGASDRELRQAAALSVRHITSIAEAGHRRIHRVAEECIEQLQDMGARPALVQAVRHAAESGHDAISTAADRGRTAIHEALQAALDD
ncbi:MAG: hypothetical protein Kow0022_18090 [Phycisphaerales bacterium]